MRLALIRGAARSASMVSIAGALACAPSLWTTSLAQDAKTNAPDAISTGSTADQSYLREREEAEAKYYKARTDEINSKWSISLDRTVTSGGLLLGLFTFWLGFRQWASNSKANQKAELREWETLRDGQFFEQISRLSVKDNPHARENAAIMVGFLGIVISTIPEELAQAALESATSYEQDVQVSTAIQHALCALKVKRNELSAGKSEEEANAVALTKLYGISTSARPGFTGPTEGPT